MGGYKFRFVDQEARPEAKLKRGFAYEAFDDGTNQPNEARTTRASRFGSVAVDTPFPIVPKLSILAPPELKVYTYFFVVCAYLCRFKLDVWIYIHIANFTESIKILITYLYLHCSNQFIYFHINR